MTTSQQIASFTAFAKTITQQEGEHLSLDEIYDRWWQEQNKTEDLAAIEQAHKVYESGERGRQLEDFLAEFDAEQAERNQG